MGDQIELAAAIDDFCSALSDEFATDEILSQLARSALGVLSVDGAGVMATVDKELMRVAYTTGGPVDDLERLQEVLQSGPCRDAHASGEVVNIRDLAVEGEWPAFQQTAIEVGLHAVTAIPL